MTRTRSKAATRPFHTRARDCLRQTSRNRAPPTAGPSRGRRSSYGGDDDYSGDGADKMDLEYTGPEDDEDEGTDPSDTHSRDSSRKKQQLETPTDNNRQIYRQHSRTYPPGPRALADPSGMAPPSLMHPGPNSTPRA
ncbi:hypothetical protein MRB53_039454 [Persea americana]|nr:hypothetical protein MRB53_039454 [Persea americana]